MHAMGHNMDIDTVKQGSQTKHFIYVIMFSFVNIFFHMLHLTHISIISKLFQKPMQLFLDSLGEVNG